MKSETREDKYPKVRTTNTPLPFDFGIKRLKKELAAGGMSESDINKTVKLYKERLYQRVEEVKTKMEKELLDASEE